MTYANEDREPIGPNPDVIPSNPVGLRQYVSERTPPPPEPAERTDLADAGIDEEKGVNLREATRIKSEATARRLEQEQQEAEAYRRAAGIEGERELPDLNKTDAELSREEIHSLRDELQRIQQSQTETYERIQAEQAQAQAAQVATEQYQQSYQQLPQVAGYVQNVAEQQLQQLTEEFPYYANAQPHEIQRAVAEDPYFAGQMQAARGRIAEAKLQAQQVVSNHSQAHEHLGAMEDAKFEEAHPEFKDRQVRAASSDGVMQMLEAAGYDRQTIAAGWTLGVGPLGNIRDHRVQEMLLQQYRLAEGKKKMANGRYRDLPPVMRPGTRSDRGSGEEEELRALDKRLSETGSLRDAARLSAAKLRWRRGQS